MKQLFDKISNEGSKVITRNYSTSFSIGVRLLAPSIRQAIYNIYGFVRVADEIVDSFKDYPQAELLDRFEAEYNYAVDTGISSNPVINAFQNTVREYEIDQKLVLAFLRSMRADLTKLVYENDSDITEYIYGSADVVGLMCLKVFVQGDQKEYERLSSPAMKLGSAFQKVNFLRDLKQDYDELSRMYFPGVDPNNISAEEKNKIVIEIKQEFKVAREGIKQLPKEARLGVYVAYKYYAQLLNQVDRTPAVKLKEQRISVSNLKKTSLLIRSYMNFKLNIY